MKLRPFQEIGRQRLQENSRYILADEMGLGKTAQALTALSELPCLVVCPASVRLVWMEEARRWRPDLTVEGLFSSKDAHSGCDITIISYDLFGKVRLRRPNTVIFDEAHYLQNYRSRRTQAAKTLTKEIRKVWFLTGTPMWSRPRSLFPLLRMVGAWKGDYLTYAKRYCDAHEDMLGNLDDSGSSNLGELKKRLAGKMMRRRKHDVAKELPEKQRQIIELPCEISDAESEYLLTEPFAKVSKRVKANRAPTGPMATVIKETALLKIPAAVEHLKNVLMSVQKVVVFAWNIGVLDALQAQLQDDYGVVRIDGSTSLGKRLLAVNQFQIGEPRVFLGQTVAAGTGITLNASSHVVFVQPDWTPANLLQAEDRVHRIGQKNSVTIQFLVTAGSIEKAMLNSALSKLSGADQVLGDERGRFAL